MTTTAKVITDTYSVVDGLEEDGIYQNTGTVAIRLHFSGTGAPVDNTEAYLILEPEDVFQKITNPLGLSYARTDKVGATGRLILAV